MNEETVAKLLTVNRLFYQNLGEKFSATRGRIQPGVQHIIAELPMKATILDLGCGNGELIVELRRRGHSGSYVGMDFSSAMLSEARQKTAGDPNTIFLPGDLSNPNWIRSFDNIAPTAHHPPFEIVFAFAALHHIPGEALRQQLLTGVHQLISADGEFFISVWQFLNSPRLRARLQPWQTINLSTQDVDTNDYLLDWRHGGYGLRYVHHFSESELTTLAQQTGFHVGDSFLSDGESGDLGLYQVWKPLPG